LIEKQMTEAGEDRASILLIDDDKQITRLRRTTRRESWNALSLTRRRCRSTRDRWIASRYQVAR